ncbi:MAG: 3-deoxy-manno-octulosonate-8-phosphatase KdsC [Betaproteobacteria bacterium]|nr:3-deoxy-manno-octulosonate-8-phosphatase KdsC [Betaproteobacteria bacterium]
MQQVYERARAIRLAIFDVDGVLTDGRIYYSDSGEELKAFHTQDGHGLKMLQASGVELAIITGRRSRCVELRAANLGVSHLYQGAEHKLEAFHALLAKLGLPPAAAAYMGDDLVDLPVMRASGLALAVPEAPFQVKRHAHYVTTRRGGAGAVREACELVMLAQGSLAGRLDAYPG